MSDEPTSTALEVASNQSAAAKKEEEKEQAVAADAPAKSEPTATGNESAEKKEGK